MNKTTTIFCLLLSMISCISPAQKIKGAWIAVDSRHYDESSWISPLDGMFMHFNADSIVIGHVYSDSLKDFRISYLDSKQLIIETNLPLETDTVGIYQVSKDSITLLFQNNMLVKLIPVDLSLSSEITLEELITNDWGYILDDKIARIHFSNENWVEGFDTQKRCVADGNVELYNLFSYQGSQFIPITIGHSNPDIYHIEQMRNDTIFTKVFTDSGYINPIIVKQTALPSEKIEKIKSKLIGNWRAIELVSYGTRNEEILGDTVDYLGMGEHFYDVKMLSKDALLENKISFQFDDSTYQINEDDQEIFEGEYKFSLDGEYIELDNGFSPRDYIQIIDLKDNILTIRKQDEFAIGLNGEYIEYLYKLKLMRKTN